MTAVRPATAADIPHILRLVRGLAEYEKLAHKMVATEADLRTLMFGPTPRAHAILAEPAGQPPVGIALYYYTISTFSGRPGIFLEDLFVDPSHRGTGLGLALLGRLAAIAVEENCVSIDWRVLEWNTPAIDFYERLGATRMTGWHVRQLNGDALKALAKGHTHG
jgi:GNAT superfamily N-acetyltransferase